MTHTQPKHEISKTWNGSGGGFLSGLLVGGLMGAATGLLLAPRSGQNTRLLIQNKRLAFRDQVTHTIEEARSQAETLVEEAKAKAEALQEQSREFIETGKERLEKTAGAALQAAQSTWTESAEEKEFAIR